MLLNNKKELTINACKQMYESQLWRVKEARIF